MVKSALSDCQPPQCLVEYGAMIFRGAPPKRSDGLTLFVQYLIPPVDRRMLLNGGDPFVGRITHRSVCEGALHDHEPG